MKKIKRPHNRSVQSISAFLVGLIVALVAMGCVGAKPRAAGVVTAVPIETATSETPEVPVPAAVEPAVSAAANADAYVMARLKREAKSLLS